MLCLRRMPTLSPEMSVAVLSERERRGEDRYRLGCVVVVTELEPGNVVEPTQGRLIDIGAHGARFSMARPLPVGARIVVEVAFPRSRNGTTTICFEGSVLRCEARHEIAVRFPEPGRFVRPDLEDLIAPDGQQSSD